MGLCHGRCDVLELLIIHSLLNYERGIIKMHIRFGHNESISFVMIIDPYGKGWVGGEIQYLQEQGEQVDHRID